MRPDWRILIDGQDRSEAFRARLLSLTITDESGYYSDTVSVRLDDRDGRIVLPRLGVEMVVQLGYEEIGRVEMGRYTVDEIELSGPPDTLFVRAPQDCPFLSRKCRFLKTVPFCRFASSAFLRLSAKIGRIDSDPILRFQCFGQAVRARRRERCRRRTASIRTGGDQPVDRSGSDLGAGAADADRRLLRRGAGRGSRDAGKRHGLVPGRRTGGRCDSARKCRSLKTVPFCRLKTVPFCRFVELVAAVTRRESVAHSRLSLSVASSGPAAAWLEPAGV